MTQTTSHALEDKYNAEDDVKKIIKHAEKKAAEKNQEKTDLEKLPNPTGWRLLVMPFKVKEETKGGIIIAQETLDRARVATQVGYVLKMGDLCYSDEEKYPTGPWCKEKDWVIFARYAGSRMEIDGGEIRMLNDDEVLGTISNPEDILHAM
jgi:co-chaperonin GroES (HSP10)